MARPLSIKKLFATPKYMRAWLEDLGPHATAATDILSSERCLCANLMRHHGYDVDQFSSPLPFWEICAAENGHYEHPPDGWVFRLVNSISPGKRITAAAALKALDVIEAGA